MSALHWCWCDPSESQGTKVSDTLREWLRAAVAPTAGYRLRVESIKTSHLAQLPNTQPAPYRLNANSLHGLIVQSWFSRFDHWLPEPFHARLTRALALIESGAESPDRIEALALMRSGNRRQTCWHLDLLALATPRHFSQQQGLRLLIQEALNDQSGRNHSWLVRCDSQDRPQLDVLREMGFQQLRHARIWDAPMTDAFGVADPIQALPEGLVWCDLTKDNVRQLLALEQASISPQHRQILDRQWSDLLDLRGGGSKMLMAERDGTRQIIAGLIQRPWGMDAPRLELMRGLAWDERIEEALPAALGHLRQRRPTPSLLVTEDDQTLADLLEGLGWSPGGLEVMLGRSVWRRVSQRNLGGIRPLESMLSRLQPQHPPLPTPSLAPRR